MLWAFKSYPFPRSARRNTIQTEQRRLHQSKRSLHGRKGPGAGMHWIPGGGVATINEEMSDPPAIPLPKNPLISEVPRFSHMFRFVDLFPEKHVWSNLVLSIIFCYTATSSLYIVPLITYHLPTAVSYYVAIAHDQSRLLQERIWFPNDGKLNLG